MDARERANRKEERIPERKHLQGVSDKEQRQYEHAKEGAEKSGSYGKRAKEVAARTMLKEHKAKGSWARTATAGWPGCWGGRPPP